MTPKEKANELMSMFNHSAFGESWKPFVKTCALSCAKEVIKALDYPESLDNADHAKYWEQVKKEIEKL